LWILISAKAACKARADPLSLASSGLSAFAGNFSSVYKKHASEVKSGYQPFFKQQLRHRVSLRQA
jgi:hypothetical protein